MPRFDVFTRLEAARIRVIYGDLPDGTNGLSCRLATGVAFIILREGLDPIAKRCTAVHEYMHLKLFEGDVFGFHDTYACRLSGDKIEAQVRRATAKKLVPAGRLRGMLKQGLWPNEIAELLAVTEEVVLDRLHDLELTGRLNR